MQPICGKYRTLHQWIHIFENFFDSFTLIECLEYAKKFNYLSRPISIVGFGLRRLADLYTMPELGTPSEIYIKFLGGPPSVRKPKSVWTASLKCFLVDFTLRELLKNKDAGKLISDAIKDSYRVGLFLTLAKKYDIFLLDNLIEH